MSWEGFGIFLALLIGGPLALAALLVVVLGSLLTSVAVAVCAAPVGVAWALAAMVRPEIVRGMRLSKREAP